MDKRIYHDYTKYYGNLVKKGNGVITRIYKGREKKTNELRAVKVIQFEKLKRNIVSSENENKLKDCENVKILSNISSVKFYEYFNDENNFIIIMELYDSNLLQLLFKKNEELFNTKEINEILKQLNNIFKIMKDNNIIHRDLKLESIFIKYEDVNKYIIKLSGYERIKRLNSLSKSFCNSNVGKIKYIAPEILKGENYNCKYDLWSMGIIIDRLKFIKLLFNEKNKNGLIRNTKNFNNNLIKKTGNEDLDYFIKKLLEKDYIKRLNSGKYFNHPFSNKINIIYYKNSEKDIMNRENNIFGYIFVENNKNNIELKINGIKIELVQKYKLEYGENKIEIIIKNKIANFEYMFYDCISLKNIEGLKYLDVSNGNNFSSMFFGCKSLSDIKPLENWDVSNVNNFSSMFFGCNSLSDIKPLENWNVSNGNNFSSMFFGCKSLSDIKPLENWNVSKGNNFSEMFNKCESLSNIKSLENWNISIGNNFSEMFNNNESLSNIKSLENLDFSNENNFSELIHNSFSDIKQLENKYKKFENINIVKDNYQNTNNTNEVKTDIKSKNCGFDNYGNINNDKNISNTNNNKNININHNINNINHINNYNNNNNYINNSINNEKQEYLKPKYIFPIKGLDNIGSTCYMNSTLQCLLHVSELVNYFLYEYNNDKNILKNKNKNSSTFGEISDAFYELILGVYSNNNNENISVVNNNKTSLLNSKIPIYISKIKNFFKSKDEENSFSPNNFKRIIGIHNSQFKDFKSNDSKDLLLYLLQAMHEELNYFGDNPPIHLPKSNQSNRVETFINFMNLYNNQNFSIISKYFYGTYEIITTCHLCKNTIYNFQKFEFISFGMFKYKKKNFDIMNGFKDNEETQELKGDNKFYCNKCKLLTEASSTCKIIQPPNILIINIDYGKNKKYNPSNIKFEDIIDITKYVNYNFGTPIRYEITGICTHLRHSGLFGHYIALCKNKENGKWYSFNDSACNEIVNKDEIYKGSPYILLYNKIE